MDNETIIAPSIPMTIDNLEKTLEKRLPAYFKDGGIVKPINETSFRIDLVEKTTIEELADQLKKVLKVHTLYGIGQKQERIQTCVMYSRPYLNNMYNIYMYSENYGNIKSFNVICFTSMDDQFIKLNVDLKKSQKKIGLVYERQTAVDLSYNFA